MKLQSKNCFITIIFGFILLANQISSSNLKNIPILPQQQIVIDHTTDPTLHHVIRRTPTLTVEHRETENPTIRHTQPEVLEFGNTSDNNGASINFNYGNNPEIAGPAIYVHSKGKISAITERPAHVGWRSEKKIITSLNKATSK